MDLQGKQDDQREKQRFTPAERTSFARFVDASVEKTDDAMITAQTWGKNGLLTGGAIGAIAGLTVACIGAVVRGAYVDAAVLAVFSAVVLSLFGICIGSMVGGSIGLTVGAVFGATRPRTRPTGLTPSP